jgi:hypothetical protein
MAASAPLNPLHVIEAAVLRELAGQILETIDDVPKPLATMLVPEMEPAIKESV